MGEQLKPCPFCGGKPYVFTMPIDHSGSVARIACRHCQLHLEVVGRDPVPGAVAKWNTRAESSAEKMIGLLNTFAREIDAMRDSVSPESRETIDAALTEEKQP